VDGLEVLKSAHADTGSGVDVEHEEAGGDREDRALTISGETVGDGSHRMFADTPMNVPTRVVAIDAAGGLEVGLLLC
jgi:hypothetical protein